MDGDPDGRIARFLSDLPARLATDLFRPTDGVATTAECLAMAGPATGTGQARGVGQDA